MKKRMINYVLAALLFLPLVSCVEDIVIDMGLEEAVAVDCVLRKQQTQTLRLYRMNEVYGSRGEEGVEEATVTLLACDDESGEYSPAAVFSHYEGAEWRTEFEPEYGVKYKLSVSIPGKEEITAETRFPKNLSLYYPLNSRVSPYCQLPDPNNVKDSLNYRIFSYEVRLESKRMEDFYKDSCKIWIFPHVDSEYGDGKQSEDEENIPDHLRWYVFQQPSKPYAKYVATDHPYADNFNMAPGTVSDLDWCNLPVQKYADGESNLLFSNLSQWPRVVCPDLPLHSSFLRIAHPADFVNKKYKHEYNQGYIHEYDQEYQKRHFYIIADYSESYGILYDFGRIPRPFVLETHFVSEEYDSYLKDVYMAKENVGDFILSAYEGKSVYSNVNGGYGIFGADLTRWDRGEDNRFNSGI